MSHFTSPLTDTATTDAVQRFRLGMRRHASGVSLITTQLGNVKAGLIATSVSSVCMDPPTLLVCVNRSSSAHDPLNQVGKFCVNLLDAHASDIASQFSNPERRQERFHASEWFTLQSSAPVLHSAIAAFDCSVVERLAYHSHTIFIGRVHRVHLGTEEFAPLIYMDGRYWHLSDLAGGMHR
ncbi:flavin reductase family protein [Paraburkholderia aromaticivorans]|uniref:Flavin reductase like domain-containing protein n=1 Tax=Paraburkholderia aromaticivorans TaxID=2026199 RepID=A0A248VYS4_9BURK|nr:flavin reductase family protein [Paraburkholderia aromaticivorans]ASW04154.1 hypothetical protein CJU94_38990 [Paraburkholderia aromaticivorans]